MVEYTERNRHWNQRGRKRYFAHVDTNDDFYPMIERDSRSLGKIGVLADWRRNAFARNMFDLIVDPRMLKEAYDSGKGEGAGHDDVKHIDIWRYFIFRKWHAACRLFDHKRPRFTDTVFPHAPALHLSALLLACEPDRKHPLSTLSLSQGNRKRAVDVSRIEPEHFLSMYSPNLNEALRTRRYMEFKLSLHRNVGYELKFKSGCLDKRHAAGMQLDVLADLFHDVTASIKEVILWFPRNAPCDRVFKFTPWSIYRASIKSDLESQGRVNSMLTWETMRWLSSILIKVKEGPKKGFKPEPLRRVEIAKPDGGKRALSLPTVIDRTVAKAVALTLQPMFEEIFLPSSTGCRTDRDRFDALATLHARYPESPGKYILCADIKKAFDNVNHDRLLSVVFRYIRNSHVQELLKRFVHRVGFERSGKGIPQGCPLSPLLLNILLHEALDKPMTKQLGNKVTYLRYVDDLCFFGFDGEADGSALIDDVQNLLEPTGLELHTMTPKTQIANLAIQSLEMSQDAPGLDSRGIGYGIDRYLGLGLRGTVENQLEYFLPSSWPERMHAMLMEAEATIAHKKREGEITAHIHIRSAVTSWVRAFAPAWAAVQERENIAREIIVQCRQASTHCDQLSEAMIIQVMEDSFARWQRYLHEAH